MQNATQICRLCLKEHDETIALSLKDGKDGKPPPMMILNGNVHWLDLIYTMTSLKVLQGPTKLIQFLCTHCQGLLNDFSEFRKKSIRNDGIFRDRFHQGESKLDPSDGDSRGPNMKPMDAQNIMPSDLEAEVLSISSTDERLFDGDMEAFSDIADEQLLGDEDNLAADDFDEPGSMMVDYLPSMSDNSIQPGNHDQVSAAVHLFHCHLCDSNFNQQSELRAHLLTQHEAKPGQRHKCDICHKKFFDSYKLKLHMKVHNGERAYKCNVCGKGFITSYILKAHLQTHITRPHVRTHPSANLFECHVCRRRFTRIANLNSHFTRMHTVDKPFECAECKKRFRNSFSLKMHIKSHSVDKIYECYMCKEKFTSSIALARHRKLQPCADGKKPFQCHVCRKTSTCFSDLRKHLRTHTGEKPFQCDMCDKSFAVSSNLYKHRAQHVQSGKHECPICHLKFMAPNSLTAHLRWHATQEDSKATPNQ